MFCKRQVELPSKATGRESESNRGELRLNDERIEFSSPMARSSQFPCHGPFRFGVHVEIESQVRHTAIREAQVESKTCGAFLTFDAKAFEFCDICFDEIWVYIRRSDTCLISRISEEVITISPTRSGSLDLS